MIFITGDTHGDVDFKKLLIVKEQNLSYNDYLIICGDAAICWSPQLLQYFLSLYKYQWINIEKEVRLVYHATKN